MYVKYRFSLNPATIKILKEMKPNFGYGLFSEFIYYRTYSRFLRGKQESWVDTIIRVVEGIFSIRKDWYLRNKIEWDEGNLQRYAREFAISMFNMNWLPPGRGLWAMGTNYVYERGGMALYNCAFIELVDLPIDYSWLMDCLMNGVGVGFKPTRDDSIKIHLNKKETIPIVIEDSREGWCDSVRAILRSYLLPEAPKPIFNYNKIRKAGEPIRGFGGLASGPQALVDLHKDIEKVITLYYKKKIDSVTLKTDIANLIGCCVVSGNVRRSAEIAIQSINDPTFIDLKDYDKFPYRAAHGWMSNNSVQLQDDSDFTKLKEIAERVKLNGEPGYINMQALKLGRVGKNDPIIEDKAIGINPCGEIPLESYEVCNVAETFPTRCKTESEWIKACEYATFYCSTVSLLPTHRPETNKVVARNRRIGISIADISGWKLKYGVSGITSLLRLGYRTIKEYNKIFNEEAGVPAAIRVTTIKPGGTIPKLVGVTSGAGHPTFKYTLRRVRVAQNIPIFKVLHDAGIPHEPDVCSINTEVFEFPILQGPAKPASEISLWEQAFNLILIQREWADNAVSNTLYFKPKWIKIEEFEYYPEAFKDETKYRIEQKGDKWIVLKYNPNNEEDDIEAVLANIAPLTKSVSLLPHSIYGTYKQMPEEGITEEEYNERVKAIKKINWSKLNFSDGQDNRYCDGEKCTL